MPRYLVVEDRIYQETTLIDAESEEAARRYEGDIVDKSSADSYGYEIISVEEVDPDDTLA